MQFIWHGVKMEDIIEAQNLARERGKIAGENYEVEFLEVMKKKGIKRSGATELTKEELISEYLSHDKKILEISHNSEGEEKYGVMKKKDEPNI